MNSLHKTVGWMAILFFSTLSVATNAGDQDKFARAWLWAHEAASPLDRRYDASLYYAHGEGWERLTTYPYTRYFHSQGTVTRTALGTYTVDLIGMETLGGVAHVTAYGSNRHCKIANWNRISGNQKINVRCFNPAGSAANAQFVLTYNLHNGRNGLPQAHLWANQPTSPSYTPAPLYSRNSTGATNQVYRFEKGVYRAYLPNVDNGPAYDDKKGTAMVTAYGTDATRCKLHSLSVGVNSGNGANVFVRCYNANGDLTDSRFTVSFMKNMGDFGSRVAETTLMAAYAFINTTPNPSIDYQKNTYGRNTTATKLSTGRYQVELDNLKSFNSTAATVTAYGTNNHYCSVIRWGRSEINSRGVSVFVNCYNNSGLLADTQFTLQYLTDEIILF